jgi:hypothetical protein
MTHGADPRISTIGPERNPHPAYLADQCRRTLRRSSLWGLHEAGRPDSIGPETSPEGVHGHLGLSPPPIVLPEQQLPRRLLGGGQPLHSDADEADSHPLKSQGVIEVADGLVDLTADIGGAGEGARPGEGGEVGEPDLDRHRASHLPGPAQASGDLVGELEQVGMDEFGVVDVVGEGLLVADALLVLVWSYGSGISPPGQFVQMPACGGSQRALESRCGGMGDIADGAKAQPQELLLGLLPHSPQGSDG